MAGLPEEEAAKAVVTVEEVALTTTGKASTLRDVEEETVTVEGAWLAMAQVVAPRTRTSA